LAGEGPFTCGPRLAARRDLAPHHPARARPLPILDRTLHRLGVRALPGRLGVQLLLLGPPPNRDPQPRPRRRGRILNRRL